MDVYEKVSSSITRLQSLPEKQRHSIFFTILTFMVLLSVIFTVFNTKNSIAKIEQNLQTANLFGSQQEELNKNTVAQNSSDLQQNVIQDQQSYYNVDYSYTIQYPDGWQVNSISPGEITISSNSLEDKEFTKSPYLVIRTIPLGINSSLDQQVQDLTKSLTSNVFLLSKITIDNQDAYLIKFICQEDACGPSERLTVKNNNVYIIDTNLESDPLVSSVISSFKFTD